MNDFNMNTLLNKKTAWWQEPMVWLLIILPLSAVIGGALTIWVAANNADSLVSEAHVKEGLAVRQIGHADQLAESLAMAANLNAEPGQLSIQLEGNLATWPGELILTMSHPADSRQDIVLTVGHAGHDRYIANYASIPAGKRLLELTPADRTWRITGTWQAPFTGSTRLLASTQFLSTQP